MAVGHWNSLAEAQKLTQSQLIPGVVEEIIKRENIIERMPVALALGKTIKWVRENKTLEDDVANVTTGTQLSWTSSMTYEEMETALKQCVIQRVLDKFIPEVYGTINNYEAQALWEMKKGMLRNLGDKLIYDDITYGADTTLEWDGLHALAAVQTGTNLDIDNGTGESGGLSLHNVRKVLNEMKGGCDAIFCPYEIGIRWDEAYEEAGFTSLKADTAGAFSLITRGMDSLGKPLYYFAGVPIIRTDYLVAEQNGVGDGSNLRAKHSSGVATYSLFFIKFGDIFAGNPGLTMGFGNPEMANQFYTIELFDKLEDYVARGIRLYTWAAPLLGSKLSLGRIFDVGDHAITA